MFLCHILVILTVFETSSLLYLLWWATTIGWELRWSLAFLALKYQCIFQLRYVCCFYCTFDRLQCTLRIIFICIGKSQKLCGSVHCDIPLLQWSQTEPTISMRYVIFAEKAMAPHSSTYSCLGNPMDGGAWSATVHGVAKSWTRLSNFTFTLHFHALEKELATHSSILAWRIPGMGAWWAAIYGVAQSRTWLMWLSSSSMSYVTRIRECRREGSLSVYKKVAWGILVMELLGVLTGGGHTNFLSHLFYDVIKSNRTVCMHPHKTGEIWMLWVDCVNSDFLAVIEKYSFCQDVIIQRY